MAAITCPTNCTSALPAVDFDICNPETHEGEIVRIFVGKAIAASFTTPASPTEWTTRVSEAGTTGNDNLRPLTVIGDKPEPTQQVKDLSNRRKKVTTKDHVINFTIDETNQKNHDFLRALECGGTYKIWYETADGLMFGGADGIIANVNLNMVLTRGVGELMVFNGTITWSSKFTEERNVSPIFGQTLGQAA